MEGGENTQTVISADVEITGKIKSSGSLRIDGKLDGDVDCTGDITVGKNAQIKGNLQVNAATIAGTLNGNVSAKDRIEMKSSARVMGDIRAKRLAVEDGVTFVGKSEVNPSGMSAPTGTSAPAPEKQGGEPLAAAPKVTAYAKS